MANVHEYLAWRGDLSFDERGFNDADNIVLSCLSYLDFSGIVPGEFAAKGISLSLACTRLLEAAQGNMAPYVRSLAKIDAAFVELLAGSRRFGSLTLREYVDVIDESRAMQFSAMQIDLPSRQTYVAFRGTDGTIVGWREDFIMSFEVIEAQREAYRYLERALLRAQAEERMVYVGGHSKGGNLAEYAAARCDAELLERVVRVYSNDGPGMAPEVIRKSCGEILGNRLVRIVPAYSIVGMLFAKRDEHRIIVESTATGIAQHDPTTWQLTRTGVREVVELQPDCVVINEAIAAWAESLSLEEREQATTELFDALGAGGAKTLAEIGAKPEGLQRVWTALEGCDERTRKVVRALVESMVNSSVGAASRAAQEKVNQLRQVGREVTEEATRYIQKLGKDITITYKRPKRGVGEATVDSKSLPQDNVRLLGPSSK